MPFGVTDFLVQSVGSYPEKIPTAATTHIRTDVAPGLATNPFAVERCSQEDFSGGPGASPLASAGLFAPLTPNAKKAKSANSRPRSTPENSAKAKAPATFRSKASSTT